MDSRWVSHLATKPKEKDEFRGAVLASIPVLERLQELLSKELELNKREQKKIDLYNNPNWMLMQADCNASQRTLEYVIDLLNVGDNKQ